MCKEDSIDCKIVDFQTEGNVIMLHKHSNKLVLQKSCYLLLINTKIINQYRITYTPCSGLNHVNYLNIIKRDHVSATVRTRLHLASGWSLDHSGAQYSYVGVRTRVGCRHMISFYNIPPIISVIQITISLHVQSLLRIALQLRYLRTQPSTYLRIQAVQGSLLMP